jgi:Cu-Zn family superoxide dismutase
MTGDCSAADGSSAGGHWNPAMNNHGMPGAASHLGDLGNFTVAADGTGTLEISNPAWTIGDGAATDVVGKAIIVHGAPDDFTTQPTGNAGARIGCGVIKAD